MTPFSARLRELREDRGLSVRALAARVHYSKTYLHNLSTGAKTPSLDVARRLDDALGADGELVALAAGSPSMAHSDEITAIELARRVTACDVSTDTIEQIGQAFDALASAYASVPPGELVDRVRTHLAYVMQLMDSPRLTLARQRQLLTAGAWLSLLGATVSIDLRQHTAAYAQITTAATLAEHAEHREIRAWCLETRAWDALTSGDHRRAVDLSQQAQTIAPPGSSAHIQATAQEGRAWARMGQRTQTRAALDRVAAMTSALPMPDRPEHHYRYDPSKADSYTATTLAWAADPAAEQYARDVIARLQAEAAAGRARPRRVTAAQLDLGLALLAAGQPDEAAAVTISALESGRVVPSNRWRAREVLVGVERTGIAEAGVLRDAYETHRPR